MASIDDRIVAMSFDNAKFEANVAKTLATLAKLNAALKNIGSTSGLGALEKAASKVNLTPLSTGLDKLKHKLDSVGTTHGFSDVEKSASKVSFGPLGTAADAIKSKLSAIAHGPAAALDTLREKLRFRGADQDMSNLETASSKVKFAGIHSAVNTVRDKLSFKGAEVGFANLEKASGNVRLAGITAAITNVSRGFSVLQGVASVALGNIVSKAAIAGGSMVKSLTINPITSGLKEYETNLNSIQTILANTEFQGSTLKDVNAALAQLNKYSDQTIYNFSEMAKNIGTFTAAGVDLDTSVSAIKGIANLAALSGSNSQQASTAMYQLSQAISSGKVSLEDWNSVVNAGMGGATFQRALALTATKMGTIDEELLKIDKTTGKVTIGQESFRESLQLKPGQKPWLTGEVLTKTLEQFTGDMSRAELKAQGFTDAQITAIQKTAVTAKKAATEVKTLSGVFDVVKESIGSGWAATFQAIFGDFEEAKTLFTGVTSFITDFVGESADARNKVLKDWRDLGGRTLLIEGIKDAFQALFAVVKPIKEAFRDIFPKKTGEDLYNLTKRFADFMAELKIGAGTAEDLKRTFKGFFAVLHIGTTIVGEILGVIADLLGAAKDGSGGFLSFTGSIGDFLVKVDKAITSGEGLTKFFDGLGAVLSVPIKLLGVLADALGSVFGGGDDSAGISDQLDGMTDSLGPMATAVNAVKAAWDGFLKVLEDLKEALGPVMDDVAEVFEGFGDAVAKAFENADYDSIFDLIQTTLIGGIFLAIKKGFSSGINIDFGGGVLNNISESFGVLTGSLKTMQRSVNASTLLKIAAAIGILATGVLLLSTIEPKKLASAMTAISVGLGQLIAAMALLGKGGLVSFAVMPVIAASLIGLAIALNILAVAVKIFSTLDWEELAKGLAGVGGALVAVGLGVKAIPPSIALIGPALIPMAIALNLMAVAVKIFSTLDWEELAKGLTGVAGALTAIGIGTKLIGPSILLIGPGLIAVAVALNLLALSVKAFGSMDLKTMAKGLGGIAASLVLIGLAIRTIPPTVALQAAGLILLSVALTGIAGAIALMGGLKIKTIAKGIAGIGAAIVVLAAGLKLMGGTIPGSIALLAAASALAILTPVIGILGNMKFKTIVKGLVAIAASIAVLAVAGLVAAPGLTALGVAMIPLGAAAALAGLGVYLLSTGLSKLGTDGVKSVGALVVALTAFIAVLPKIIIGFLKGLVEVAAAIAKLAPDIVESMVKIIEMLLDVVIEAAPKMAEAVGALISAFLKVLVDNAPKIVAAGFKLLLDLLSGINDNIVEVITTVGEIIVKFLTALAVQMPKIVAAGATILIKFLEGVASKLPELITAATKVIVKFLEGIAQNIAKVVAAAVDVMVQFLKGLTQNISKLIDAGADFIVKVLKGVADNVHKVAKAATNMVGEFLDAAAKAALDLVDAGAKAVLKFLNGIADAIRKYGPEFGKAGRNIASAIVEGVLGGIEEFAGDIPKKLIGIAKGGIKAFMGAIGADSPSKVFHEIGGYMMQGLSIGVDKNATLVNKSLESSAEGMIDTMASSLRAVPDILDGLLDMDPVITPVLDLTNVEASAKRLGDLTNVVPITAAASYVQAVSISAAQEAAQTASEEPTKQPPQEIKFEQNNYSPESLTPIEVYRQTRNQLAQAKTVLGVS